MITSRFTYCYSYFSKVSCLRISGISNIIHSRMSSILSVSKNSGALFNDFVDFVPSRLFVSGFFFFGGGGSWRFFKCSFF